MTPLLLATAFLFPPPPAVQAEGRVTVRGVKVGLVSVRRAEIDYVLRADGSLRATGTLLLAGDVAGRLVYLVGDTTSGVYTAKVDVFGGRIDLTGRLSEILKQLLPE